MTGPRDGIVPPPPTKIQLAGHAKILNPVGRSVPRQPTPGGWNISCICGGWPVENHPTKADATNAYRRHLTTALPVCKLCGEAKPVGAMTKSNHGLCKACALNSGQRWRLNHFEADFHHKRRHWLMKKYGLTPEAYDALLAQQAGVCAICKEPPADPRGFKMHVDHDHRTGEVRGILCGACNRGLGSLGDTLERVEAAAAYLRNASQGVARCG